MVFGCLSWVSGWFSYPPGLILESGFLWRCFCRQEPPCNLDLIDVLRARPQTLLIRRGIRSTLGRDLYVVALWEALYIENTRFDLDTLTVSNRSPTPI